VRYRSRLVANFAIIFFVYGAAALADGPRLQRDGPVARDYINKLEWMRCSVGQHWEKETCVGEVLMLSVPEAQEVIQRISNLDGGWWLLPTVK